MIFGFISNIDFLINIVFLMYMIFRLIIYTLQIKKGKTISNWIGIEMIFNIKFEISSKPRYVFYIHI